MTLAEANRRALAMGAEERARLHTWANGAVREVAEEYNLDEAIAGQIVGKIVQQRIAEIEDNIATLMHKLRSISRPAPRMH